MPPPEIQAPDARNCVETAVEGGDPLELVVEHHSRVNRVAHRYASHVGQKIASAVSVGQSHTQDYRADVDEQVIDFPSQVQTPKRRNRRTRVRS